VRDRRDNGNDFRFEATIRPDEDANEAETRWYPWNKEVKRWEFYGNETPSWGELSERNQDTFAREFVQLGREAREGQSYQREAMWKARGAQSHASPSFIQPALNAHAVIQLHSRFVV
jgi:hypothetical protein